MKILVDARSLGEKPSGVGMYLYNFIMYLYKAKEELFLLTDISTSKELKTLHELGIPIISYKKKCRKNVYIFHYFMFIQQQIYFIKPNIFWEGNNLIPFPLKNPYGKICITIHDIFPVTHIKYYSYIYQFYFKFFIKRSIKWTDIILYNSRETKKNVESVFPFAKEKNNFISYIIVENKYNFNIKDKGYFLYIGNCERRKGTDILLEAYKQYINQGGSKPLYIIGSIREVCIQNIIDTMRHIPTFKYIGYVSEEEKEQYLAECSCFVFPSIAEGFGIPILEAMYYKKTIIASNLPIFKEIVGDSINYFDLCVSKEKQIENLVYQLFFYHKRELFNDVELNYCSENLGKSLINHFNSE